MRSTCRWCRVLKMVKRKNRGNVLITLVLARILNTMCVYYYAK